MEESDYRVLFETSWGEALVEIRARSNENDLSLSDYGEEEQALLAGYAKEESWIAFDVAVSEEVRSAGGDHYELSYAVQESQAYCPAQVTTRLYPGQSPSYEPFVLEVYIRYCEEYADPYAGEALAMLDSFRPSGQVAASTPDAEMSASEVYAAVSPSVPFIETPAGTGSGVLTGRGYVVTNYHVVWPYEYAWVVFPDGSEFQAPVVGWDPITDIAVLGPVDAAARPLRLESGEALSPGAELFLVGYPAEVEAFPKATITRGILSRLREWEQAELTYVQTDAGIAGGQSGGALVNSRGGVIGISGFSFSEAQFGLAASSADVLRIVNGLIDGRSPYGLGDRRHPTGRGAFTFDVQLDNRWDTRVYAVNTLAGTELVARLDGSGDGQLRVSGPTGQLMYVDHNSSGVERGTVELPVDGIYFVQANVVSDELASFELSSNIRMQPFHDPDDGVAIETGQTIAASLDYAYDTDWFSINLNEGETVGILADSLLVDTLIVVDFPGSRDDQVVFDDDGGGGMFGTNSWLVYRAPKSGEYWIVVSQVDDSRMGGGYFLSVERAPRGSETVHVPQ